MENEKEKNYFIIWLYISILLHVFMVIIMLSIKSIRQSQGTTEPHTRTNNYDAAQVIFVQDQDEPEPPQPQDYKMATRTQGGTTTIEPSEAPQPQNTYEDVPAPALSDEYKKALLNQTTMQDQDDHGDVTITDAAIIDEHKQPEKQIEAPSASIEEKQHHQKSPGELLQAVIAEKMAQAKEQMAQHNASAHEFAHEPLQPVAEKVISKKHRPAPIGSENLSKVQLSKIIPHDTPTTKKKLSLQDLQQGFSAFIKNNHTQQIDGSYSTIARPGNSAYFSSIGNAPHDDAEGLRMASYLRQVGQMYHNAHQIMPRYQPTQKQMPSNDSVIAITIERSGKISLCEIMTSCGIPQLDQHHIEIIQSIGSFPPIPKYIDAPLKVPATLFFNATPRTFTPPIQRR